MSVTHFVCCSQFRADWAHGADTAGRHGNCADTDGWRDDFDDEHGLPDEPAGGRRRHSAVPVGASVRHSSLGTRAVRRHQLDQVCDCDDGEWRRSAGRYGGVQRPSAGQLRHTSHSVGSALHWRTCQQFPDGITASARTSADGRLSDPTSTQRSRCNYCREQRYDDATVSAANVPRSNLRTRTVAHYVA